MEQIVSTFRARSGLLVPARSFAVLGGSRIGQPSHLWSTLPCLTHVTMTVAQSRLSSGMTTMRQMDRIRSKKEPMKAPTPQKELMANLYNDSRNITMLLPGTFVRPPFSRFPRSPKLFLRFLYLWLKQRALDWVTLHGYKFASKPRLLSRARYAINKGQIVPAAKDLHAAMSRALASGDKDGLRRVCCTPLYGRLCAVIEARPAGRRYGWELVRYRGKPRVVDDKIVVIDPKRYALRQAVVAIPSRQRLVEYESGSASPARKRGDKAAATSTAEGAPGRVVSEKEVDLVEYVVLSAVVDSTTEKQLDWALFGTVKPTTMESYESERALLKAVEEADLAKYKV